MEKGIISAENKLKDIKTLTKNIEDSSNFIKNLDKEDMKLYKNILRRVQEDTNGEFTETEYEGISKMILFCDKLEEFFNSVGVSSVDTELLDMYRKMKTQITVFMQEFRDGKKITPPSIQMIKIQLNKIADIEDELDGMKVIDTDAVVIDVEDEKKDEKVNDDADII